MPFKLKLKRTKRYEVSSKNAFNVSVHMLDGSVLECTLNTDSLGRDCFSSLSQRIELEETQYFGLRYVSKKLQFRWVDLRKPLKKQLDKFAHIQDLYLAIMFYVPNAHRIQDDVARYQYFLQLRHDVIDNKLSCSKEDAIQLAAYSLQVEYGDLDNERYNVEYFQELQLLPKNMTKDEEYINEMTNEIVHYYARLQGVHPVKAEVQYIRKAQQLIDYGHDYFQVKDEKGKDLFLGTSFEGIFTNYVDSRPTVFSKWADITRISKSKKSLEYGSSKSVAKYQLDDPDTAKYFCWYCTQLQNFYQSYKPLSASMTDISVDTELESAVIPDIQQNVPTHSSNPDVMEHPGSISYAQDPHYGSDTRSGSVAMESYYHQSIQSLDGPVPDVQPQQYVDTASESSFGHSQQTLAAQQHVTEYTKEMRSVALPAYRPSPSYDTVMKHRMLQNPTGAPPNVIQGHSLGNAQIYSQSDGSSYSQPEIRQTHPMYTSDGQYIDTSVPSGLDHATYAQHVQDAGHGYQQTRVINERPAMQPTYSSPELSSQDMQYQTYATENSQIANALSYHFIPPPPYPQGSSSTPDLAAQTLRTSSASESPDLVSRKSLGIPSFEKQVNIHRSVENLAEDIPGVKINQPAVSGPGRHKELVHVEGPTIQDDAASDLSDATFHAKESDPESSGEEEERRMREQGRKKVQIRYVSPDKAPSPSKAKEVATLRESFRRNLIRRATSLGSGDGMSTVYAKVPEEKEIVSVTSSLASSILSEKIQEESLSPNLSPSSSDASDKASMKRGTLSSKSSMTSTSSEETCERKNKDSSSLASENEIKKQIILENISDSQFSEPIDVKIDPSKSDSSPKSDRQSFSDRLGTELIDSDNDSIACLKSSDMGSERGSMHRKRTDSLDTASSLSFKENEDTDARSDRVDYDSDEDTAGVMSRPNMGPMKMAAMNGLTLSRPMVLALMNDETRAPKDERRKCLESKIAEGQVFAEFEDIFKVAKDLECNIARSPSCQAKNRFRDVLPYDSTRVKITPKKNNPYGYVNASHVRVSVGSLEWWFIAAQAPLVNTTAEFWQMIWEQEVNIIAMLTAMQEQGRPKCFAYWPQEAGIEHKQRFGDYEVILMFSNDSLCYVTNRISIQHIPTGLERQVWHLQYTDWPDHGCPDDTYGFLGFLDEVESVQRLAEEENGGRKSPIFVHCSAGVGRTGVMILTEVIKSCLEHNQNTDLQKALVALRRQRMYMVQTIGQYIFVHNTLIQYLKNTRLI